MKTYPLGELGRFYSGGTPSRSRSEFWQGDIPWFSAKDMKLPRLTNSIEQLSGDAFRSTTLRKLPPGTVAMVVRGMILAHTVPVAVLDVESAINQDLKAFIPRVPLEPSFLAAMLRAQHDSILSQVSTAAHGTKKLDSRVLEAIEIPLPELGEQQRIAGILDQADALRAKRRQVLAHLIILTQSIYEKVMRSESFDLLSAGDIMPRMRNGVSPATGGRYLANVLTLSAITSGTFAPGSVKSGLFESEPPADKRVSLKDFLVCRGNGNLELVGVGVSTPIDRMDLVFPDTVIAGRVDESKATIAFLEIAWRQRTVRRQIESLARTTNGTFKVNQQTLSTVKVPIPSMLAQKSFAASIQDVADRRIVVDRSIRHFDELFVSLQNRAFRGEL